MSSWPDLAVEMMNSLDDDDDDDIIAPSPDDDRGHARFHLNSHDTSSTFFTQNRDYIDINIATPRLAVQPDMVDLAYQPLSKAWVRAKLINVMEIKRVASGQVVVVDSEGNEQVLEADGIIVATGAVQSSPLIKDVQGKSKVERKAEFTAFRDAIANSKAGVLVIGGGSTGVELIAEVATDYSNVKCTLVNKPKLLLSESFTMVWEECVPNYYSTPLPSYLPMYFRRIVQEICHAQNCDKAAE